ncbi:MAG: serine/threonine-protein kinase [Polyangiaceae bacterium]
MKAATSSPFRAGEPMPGTEWVMRGVLGQGGMGTVFEVRKGRDLRAAMKVLHPGFARSRAFEEQFEQEVEVMARLRHPNIVWVWDCGLLSDGSPFFLMELLAGRNLRDVMEDLTMPLTAEAVWTIVGQICAGLTYAHGERPAVVHRDLKPENVFLHGHVYGEFTVKLLDFGIAQVLGGPHPTQTIAGPNGGVLGTPRYMAPELLRSQPLSAKADLYALAVIVYELLTDRLPWNVDARSTQAVCDAHLKLEPTAPSFWKRWIPKSVDECLLQALSKDPNRRQGGVGEFYAELAELEVVDDGSANFRTDAPTVPTAETIAHGRITAITDAGLADVDKQGPQGRRGGWVELARSRLADPSAAPAAPRETERQGPKGQPMRQTTKANGAISEPVPDARTAGAAPERPAHVDRPTPKPTDGGKARRTRRPAAAQWLGAGVLVMAGTWAGVKASHSAPASLGGQPSSMALGFVPAPERAMAPEVRIDVAAEGSAAVERAAAVHSAAATTAHGEASLPPNVSGAHRITAPVHPRPRPIDSPKAPPNLDDVFFGLDEPNQAAPSSSANHAAQRPRSPEGTAQPPNLDDVFFGLDEPKQSAPSSSASHGARPSRPAGGAEQPPNLDDVFFGTETSPPTVAPDAGALVHHSSF